MHLRCHFNNSMCLVVKLLCSGIWVPTLPTGEKVHFTVWQGCGLWHSAVTVSPFSATQQESWLIRQRKTLKLGLRIASHKWTFSTYENKTGKGDIRHVFIAIRKRGQHKGKGCEPLLLLHVCMLHVRVRLGATNVGDLKGLQYTQLYGYRITESVMRRVYRWVG